MTQKEYIEKRLDELIEDFKHEGIIPLDMKKEAVKLLFQDFVAEAIDRCWR